MDRRINQENWFEVIRELERFDGSIAEFCRQKKLSPRALHYWRARFRKFNELMVPSGNQVAAASRSTQSSSFCRVELDRSRGSMPDPEWLAELIMSLQSKVLVS